MEVIFGNKIYLRPILFEDTDLIVKWRNQKYVQDNFIYREQLTSGMHDNWMKTKVANGEVIQYVICTNDSIPIGSVYFRDIDNENRQSEFGIFIGEKNALGKGYGSEATYLFVKFGFEKLNFLNIKLRVLDYNIHAIRLYENIGFKRISESYEISAPSGKELKVIYMEICNFIL